MTTRAKKDQERWLLARLFERLGLELPSDVGEGETPDFIVSLGDKRTGVEMTWYQSGDLTEDGVLRRQAEGEWEIFEASALRFRETQPHLRDVTVILDFKASAPMRRDHQPLLEEISAFILDHADELGSQGRDYGSAHFSTPVMKRYLRELGLRPGSVSLWSSNLQGGWIGQPDETLTRIVLGKAKKDYRPVDTLWLAIVCGYRPSEIISPINGAADFDLVKGLEDALKKAPFSRVLVWAHSGLFEWTRSGRWRQLESRC